jgi:hypothetical protein
MQNEDPDREFGPMEWYDYLDFFYGYKEVVTAWEHYQKRPNSVRAAKVIDAAASVVDTRIRVKQRLLQEKTEMQAAGFRKLLSRGIHRRDEPGLEHTQPLPAPSESTPQGFGTEQGYP